MTIPSRFPLVPLLCALAALSALAGTAVAAPPEDQAEPYTLGEVVVSATGTGVQASETVSTVNAEEIRSRGARTLDQAIALLPGVNVRTGGEGVPRIDIRGFRTRHVLLLVDGIPMNSALDQQFDPTSITVENIAEIKLTSGASSVLYGQGGLGGVINIITRTGSPGVQGTAAAETGDHEPYLVKAALSGASDRFHYFLSGSASQVDAFPLSSDFRPTSEQGSGYRSNSDRRRGNLLGTVGFTPNQDLSLGLTLNYSEGSFGKPAGAINDPNDPFAAPPKYLRVTGFNGISAQLAAEYAATSRLNLRGWAYLNWREEHENQYDNGGLDSFSADGSYRQRVETLVRGITLQPRYDFGQAGSLTLSLGAEQDSWDNSGDLSVVPVAGGAVTFSALSARKSLGLYSAGAEYEISPLPGLGLVAGYGHYWQTRAEGNQDDYALLAGANYDLPGDTRLKASFKRNVRFPSLGDLYDLTKGNPQLAAERSYSYEAGVERKLPLGSSVGVTAFYTSAKNLIQNDQATGRNLNLSEVRFAGSELAASSRPLANLLVRASYAFLWSQDRSRAGRDQQQYTPGDKVTLEGKYDASCGFTPYLSVLYVGNQYFYTKNNVTPVQKAKLNDYTLVNLRLSQKVPAYRATVYLGADNLFDQNYETSYGFPQAGRLVYGGVEFRM